MHTITVESLMSAFPSFTLLQSSKRFDNLPLIFMVGLNFFKYTILLYVLIVQGLHCAVL